MSPSATPATGAPVFWWRDAQFVAWLVVLVGLGLLLTVQYALKRSMPFADTHTYLEVGRNFLEGRGFITRFNVVYGWSGELAHPGLAYYNPLYGLLLALVWQAVKDPAWLGVWAAAVPAVANVLLLAVLLRPALGNLGALLSAAGYLLLPATYMNIALISAEHPMVTLCLVVLLLVQRVGRRPARAWFRIGLVLGVSYLIKVTIIAAIPALLVALFLTLSGGGRERLKAWARPALLLVAGFAAIILPFNVLAKATTGKWYPEYPLLARNWSLATLYGGRFVTASPAIQVDTEALPTLAEYYTLAVDNLRVMFRTVGGDLGFVTLFIVVGLWAGVWRRRADAVYLLCMGAAFFFLYPVTYYWLSFAREAGSPQRYVQHVAPFWYPLAIAGLMALAMRLPYRVVWQRALLVVFWVLLSWPALDFVRDQHVQVANEPRSSSEGLERMMAVCRETTRPDDLIGVAGSAPWIKGAMFLDRPVVALPQVNLMNDEDSLAFLRVFQPKLVIPGNNSSMYRTCIKVGYEQITVPSTRGPDYSDVALLRPDSD